MKVELKNFKYQAETSEETPCFAATLYVNGKRRGTVLNNGHGGAHIFSDREAEREIDQWAKTQPPVEALGMTLPLDAELVVSNLVNDALLARSRKRLGKRVLRGMGPVAPGHVVVVGLFFDGDALAAIGCRAASIRDAKAALAKRRGIAAYDVYSAGKLVDSSGQLSV